MELKINNKKEALEVKKKIDEYLATEDTEWVRIDYSVIPKEVFDMYGVKPFEIMKRKMRKENGNVWNKISWNDAKKEANKLGYRLTTIQELLVLLHVYKEKYPNNASVNHDKFLGIEELAYRHDVCYEWIDAPSPCIRGGGWVTGSSAGAFAVNLNWYSGDSNNNVGFRMCKSI